MWLAVPIFYCVIGKEGEIMHKFLRAVGFSMYQKKRDVDSLIDQLIKESDIQKMVLKEDETQMCEIRIETAPGMGVVVYGELDQHGEFHKEYYFPYLIGGEPSSTAECTIQRHTEKETYAGMLDEYRVGISLIFYVLNGMEYKTRLKDRSPSKVESVTLAGLSVSGKILLPVQKTEKQKEKARVASKNRNHLLEAAKNGDEDAMETLTIEDIDLYSQVSRRLVKEDIYTIIDSFFMPCGVECDQYSIIGEITDIQVEKNRISEEEVYNLTLDCNDMVFQVGINKKDLMGEPLVGRRFKGQIWMQGFINFQA